MTQTAHPLAALRAEASDCRACHLWKDATQTVFGEGPPHASLMLVGEQSGDKEDLAGKLFVGPAGDSKPRTGASRNRSHEGLYHQRGEAFQIRARGKIRLHQKPNTPEVKACRPWYERELAAVRPLVIALSATAAQSVFGKITPIGKNRGHFIDLDESTKALVTVHPSYLPRLPDEDAKRREYGLFLRDLKMAAALLIKLKSAA
jgi:DNA polymerase